MRKRIQNSVGRRKPRLPTLTFPNYCVVKMVVTATEEVVAVVSAGGAGEEPPPQPATISSATAVKANPNCVTDFMAILLRTGKHR